MYSDWSAFGGLVVAVIFIWLGILSFFVWQGKGFLKSLFPKSGERDIRRKFEEVLEEVSDSRGDLERLTDRVSGVEQLGLRHIQKVSLIRYNPYDDTGGDQSFTLALLDDKGTGVVLTSLHARSGTRVFAKHVILGKGSKHQLSKEEELVIKKAME